MLLGLPEVLNGFEMFSLEEKDELVDVGCLCGPFAR